MRSSSILIGASLVALLALETDALAYRCTAVPNAATPISQAWTQRCIPYWINQNSQLFSGQDRRDLIAQSWRAWSGNPCTDLDFYDAGYTSDGVGFDSNHPANNKNVIVAIEDPLQLSNFSDPSLIALTLTSFSVDSGEIFDADIMVNAVKFKFIDVTDAKACQAMINSKDGPYDLRNTITHEMGHFIGFDHDPDIHSVMYMSAQPCETMKRQLTSADQLGLCTVYPTGQPVHTCQPPPNGYDNVQGDPTQFRDQCSRAMGLTPAHSGCSDVQVSRRASFAGVGLPWALVFGTVAVSRRFRPRR